MNNTEQYESVFHSLIDLLANVGFKQLANVGSKQHSDVNKIHNNMINLMVKPIIIIPKYTCVKPFARSDSAYYITLNESVDVELDKDIYVNINNIKYCVINPVNEKARQMNKERNKNYCASSHTCQEEHIHAFESFFVPEETEYTINDILKDPIGLSHLTETTELFSIRPNSIVLLPAGTIVALNNYNGPKMILKDVTVCTV